MKCSMQPELSIVIPAKDEANCLPVLIEEIQYSLENHVKFELIIVDDGSSDDTYFLCKQVLSSSAIDYTLLRNKHACGQSTAISQGVEHAKGRYLLTLDADGQNDPKDIPRLLEIARLQTNDDFCIIGHRKQRKDSRWVRFQSKIANRIRCWILRDDTPDSGCALKLLPLRTFRKIPYFNHMHRFTPALVKRLGGVTLSVPISHRPRFAGKSHYNAWDRTMAGLIDLFGVAWLLHRARLPDVERFERCER